MLKDNPLPRGWFKQESSIEAIADLNMIHTLQTVLHKQTQLLKNSCIIFPFIREFLFAFGFFPLREKTSQFRIILFFHVQYHQTAFCYLEPSIWTLTQQQQ